MKDRLLKLILKGHGESLEAIKLEEDVNLRIEKLKKYIRNRPNNRARRRAVSLLEELTSGDDPTTRKEKPDEQ